ncbi:serotriflin-like [Tiliqua scincoides]|uniref:serotriflin-like n=1 Tax=Tiliqua scincoides TaxID=71010 RepID=UPI00346323FD
MTGANIGNTNGGWLIILIVTVGMFRQLYITLQWNAPLESIPAPCRSYINLRTWSNKAAKSAWQWAKQCNPVSSPEKMRTVDGTVCGETRLQSINAISWSNIIDVWVAKRSNFKYGVGAIDSKKDVYGYTQLIWYNTHEIGCAVVHCKDNEYKFFYVCHTCPAGNIKKLIPIPYKNGPSCDDCPNRCEEKLCTNL